MPADTASAIVEQLHDAGLNLSLAPAGGLAVAPSSHLTADLRDLIRSSKALLIDWLTAANDAASHAPDLPDDPLDPVGVHTTTFPSHAPDPPDDPLDWKELAAAYHAHHFNCPTCIAAGRGSHYGQRCGAGMALWRAYCE